MRKMTTMTTRKNIAERINCWTSDEERFTIGYPEEEYIMLTQKELDELKEKVFSNMSKGLSEHLEVWTNKTTGLTYFRTLRNKYGVAIMVVSDEKKDEINKEKAEKAAARKQKRVEMKKALIEKLNVKDELAEIPVPDEKVTREAVSRYYEALMHKYGDMFILEEKACHGYSGVNTWEMNGYDGKPQAYVRCDIRSKYDWDEIRDMVDLENEVSVNVEHVYIEIGLRFMGDMTVEQMRTAADQAKAAAQVAERFNERMKDVLVVY